MRRLAVRVLLVLLVPVVPVVLVAAAVPPSRPLTAPTCARRWRCWTAL